MPIDSTRISTNQILRTIFHSQHSTTAVSQAPGSTRMASRGASVPEIASKKSVSSEQGPSNPDIQPAEHSPQPDGSKSNSTAENSTVDANQRAGTQKYYSRNERKGRHTTVEYGDPETWSERRQRVGRGVWRMFSTRFWEDISALLAVIFSVACIVLTVDAIFWLLPYSQPGWENSPRDFRGMLALCVVGCTLFFIGTLLGFVEAVNVNRRKCLAWELRDDPENPNLQREDRKQWVPTGSCSHLHNYDMAIGYPASWSQRLAARFGKAANEHPRDVSPGVKWIFFPKGSELKHHLWYDFGFLSAVLLMFSSGTYVSTETLPRDPMHTARHWLMHPI